MKKLSFKNAMRDRSTGIKKFPKRHLLVVTGVAAAVMTVIGLLPSSQVEAKRSEMELVIDGHQTASPKEELKTVAVAISTAPSVAKETEEQKIIREQAKQEAARIAAEDAALGSWQTLTVKSGNNLSTLFDNAGLSARVVYNISKTPEFGKKLTDIRPGQTLKFRVNAEGTLTQMRYVQDRLNSIFFENTDKGYTAQKITLTPEVRVAYTHGTIKNSLFLASQKAGMTQKMTMELAGLFGWDVDFALDIREGDSFNLIYEEKYLDGEKLGNGNILAASFTNRGETFKAIRYTDKGGDSDYYSPDGKSMKKAFLRTPVDFTRISSKFNPNRLHPIFKTKRPHRAVDYAAKRGTPIKAAGDGRIKFIGRKKGYGNVVYIQHPNNVVTLYAHQSRVNKKLKKGYRVKQGQIIGYVGSTGWATGPHLHYEFRVNGVHRNPITVKLPDAAPIAKSERVNFKAHANKALAQLEQHNGTMLASNEQ